MLGGAAGADDDAGGVVAAAAEALVAWVAAGVPDAAAGAAELLQAVSAITKTAPDAQQVSMVLYTSFLLFPLRMSPPGYQSRMHQGVSQGVLSNQATGLQAPIVLDRRSPFALIPPETLLFAR
jgi:hypothetical protein